MLEKTEVDGPRGSRGEWDDELSCSSESWHDEMEIRFEIGPPGRRRATVLELRSALDELSYQYDEAIEDQHNANKRVEELAQEIEDITEELAMMGVEP